MVAGAASATLPRLARAAEPDFSVVVANDPQYLAATCGSGYSAMMQWVVDNQASTVDGSPLNVKAAISAGDCVNSPENTGEASAAALAWGVLDRNGIPWSSAPGNHDMVGDADLSGRVLAASFQAGGIFSPGVRASQACWSGALPGGGGYCEWGGAYDASGANTYFRLVVGSRKQLYLFLEFHPRAVVLEWAEDLHDSHAGFEVIVVTHSYLSGVGEQVQRNVSGKNLYSLVYGPDNYRQGASPSSASGEEMWSGSDTFGGFKKWTRLRMIVCGHWIWKRWHLNARDQESGWVWNNAPITSESERRQTVHQLFANVQEADNTYDYATGGTAGKACEAAVESAHLFILKFCPSIAKLRFYGLSTHTGSWVGPKGTFTSAAPVRLFDVDWPAEPASFFPHQFQHKRGR